MLVNKSLPDRQPHDFQIEPNGPMLDVIEIALNPFFKRGVATPATDLRPPSNSGLHFMLEHIEGNLFSNFLDYPRPFRSRPNDAHLAHQDIPKLRQLIEAHSAQILPDWSHAGIILLSQQRMIAGMIRAHRTKLEHHERLSIQPHSLLSKENRARRSQFNQQRNQSLHR